MGQDLFGLVGQQLQDFEFGGVYVYCGVVQVDFMLYVVDQQFIVYQLVGCVGVVVVVVVVQQGVQLGQKQVWFDGFVYIVVGV